MSDTKRKEIMKNNIESVQEPKQKITFFKPKISIEKNAEKIMVNLQQRTTHLHPFEKVNKTDNDSFKLAFSKNNSSHEISQQKESDRNQYQFTSINYSQGQHFKKSFEPSEIHSSKNETNQSHSISLAEAIKGSYPKKRENDSEHVFNKKNKETESTPKQKQSSLFMKNSKAKDEDCLRSDFPQTFTMQNNTLKSKISIKDRSSETGLAARKSSSDVQRAYLLGSNLKTNSSTKERNDLNFGVNEYTHTEISNKYRNDIWVPSWKSNSLRKNSLSSNQRQKSSNNCEKEDKESLKVHAKIFKLASNSSRKNLEVNQKNLISKTFSGKIEIQKEFEILKLQHAEEIKNYEREKQFLMKDLEEKRQEIMNMKIEKILNEKNQKSFSKTHEIKIFSNLDELKKNKLHFGQETSKSDLYRKNNQKINKIVAFESLKNNTPTKELQSLNEILELFGENEELNTSKNISQLCFDTGTFIFGFSEAKRIAEEEIQATKIKDHLKSTLDIIANSFIKQVMFAEFDSKNIEDKTQKDDFKSVVLSEETNNINQMISSLNTLLNGFISKKDLSSEIKEFRNQRLKKKIGEHKNTYKLLKNMNQNIQKSLEDEKQFQKLLFSKKLFEEKLKNWEENIVTSFEKKEIDFDLMNESEDQTFEKFEKYSAEREETKLKKNKKRVCLNSVSDSYKKKLSENENEFELFTKKFVDFVEKIFDSHELSRLKLEKTKILQFIVNYKTILINHLSKNKKTSDFENSENIIDKLERKINKLVSNYHDFKCLNSQNKQEIFEFEKAKTDYEKKIEDLQNSIKEMDEKLFEFENENELNQNKISSYEHLLKSKEDDHRKILIDKNETINQMKIELGQISKELEKFYVQQETSKDDFGKIQFIVENSASQNNNQNMSPSHKRRTVNSKNSESKKSVGEETKSENFERIHFENLTESKPEFSQRNLLDEIKNASELAREYKDQNTSDITSKEGYEFMWQERGSSDNRKEELSNSEFNIQIDFQTKYILESHLNQIKELKSKIVLLNNTIANLENQNSDFKIMAQKVKIEARINSRLKLENDELRAKIEQYSVEKTKLMKQVGDFEMIRQSGEHNLDDSIRMADYSNMTGNKHSSNPNQTSDDIEGNSAKYSLFLQLKKMIIHQLRHLNQLNSEFETFVINHKLNQDRLLKKVAKLKRNVSLKNTSANENQSTIEKTVTELNRKIELLQLENDQLKEVEKACNIERQKYVLNESKVDFLKNIELTQSKEISNLRQSLSQTKNQMKSIEQELSKLHEIVRNCNVERNLLLDEILSLSGMPFSMNYDETGRHFLQKNFEKKEEEDKNSMVPNLEHDNKRI